MSFAFVCMIIYRCQVLFAKFDNKKNGACDESPLKWSMVAETFHWRLCSVKPRETWKGTPWKPFVENQVMYVCCHFVFVFKGQYGGVLKHRYKQRSSRALTTGSTTYSKQQYGSVSTPSVLQSLTSQDVCSRPSRILDLTCPYRTQVTNLYSQLGYSAGVFQALKLLVL